MNDEIPEPSPQHYSGEHQPNQHPEGPRAPIPVSREPWEHAESLEKLLQDVKSLRRKSRAWWQDALWPEYELQLYNYLWKLYYKNQESPLNPELWDELMQIRHYLHLHQIERDVPPQTIDAQW
jgi:hypothetical protein